MSAISATIAGRRAAESLMLDAGKAMRPTGEIIPDPVLQREVEQFDESFGFTSRCKVQTRNIQARDAEVGARTSVEVRTELHLPAGTTPLEAGDVWEFTAVHPLSFAEVGQQVRVLAPVAGSLKTARRYEVEEVVS